MPRASRWCLVVVSLWHVKKDIKFLCQLKVNCRYLLLITYYLLLITYYLLLLSSN